MGLDIWFKEDIANILRAADEANLSALAASDPAAVAGVAGESAVEVRRAYRRGFVAALATLALALGLPTAGPGPRVREELVAGMSGAGRPSAAPMSLSGGRRWEE